MLFFKLAQLYLMLRFLLLVKMLSVGICTGAISQLHVAAAPLTTNLAVVLSVAVCLVGLMILSLGDSLEQ